MMQPDQFYLISAPFFWTFVGRYVRHLNFQELVLADAVYFTRTGRTFDELCSAGMVERGDGKSLYHALKADLIIGGEVFRGGVIVPAQGPKFPWTAPTPWVAKRERR